MDFILFPPTAKHGKISQSDGLDSRKDEKTLNCSFARQSSMRLTWWGQARGPWFLSPVPGEYEHVRASAEWKVEHKIYISNNLVIKTLLMSTAAGITSSPLLLRQTFPCSPSCCNGSAGRTRSCTGTCHKDGGRVNRRWRAGGLGKPLKHALKV